MNKIVKCGEYVFGSRRAVREKVRKMQMQWEAMRHKVRRHKGTVL